VVDETLLASNFESLVVGAHQFGCGIESQLESWYRFLVQPDPYKTLALSQGSSGTAQWVGVDTVLLAQRADFLRPDSLVAVIVLSDENDSEVDVRSFGGSAWNFMSSQFHAKAYPTVRDLLLAELLGQVPGANEGVISSICPIHVVDATPTGTDPLYGYRPAMSAIVERLKTSLL
jgi:hypothetical protein